MNKIDLIIEVLENSEPTGTGWVHVHEQKHQAALAAARELKDELYAKEMEQPTPTQSGTISITVNKGLEADIDLLWQVNSADIAALEDAKETLETIRKTAPITLNPIIYQSLSLIYKALDMSHSDAFQRIIDKARG